MINDFKEFCTWMYVVTDDIWLKIAPFFKRPGPQPEYPDSELLAMALIGECRGCATETEIATAEEYGAEICKVFPGETVGGPVFIKGVMAPCPWHRLMPTGGADSTEASVSEWIKAGAAAVGMGSKLITKQAISDKDYDGIAKKASDCVGWIKKARAK